MGGGRGVDGQRAGVADVGGVVEQLELIYEAGASFTAVGELEADQGAEAAGQVFIGVNALGAGLERGVGLLRHPEPAPRQADHWRDGQHHEAAAP